MSGNSFGSRFQITSFGESHGAGLGVVIDGCPAQVRWDEGLLLAELSRRRPGQKIEGREVVVTSRQESDVPEILSGIFEGLTLGTPIAMLVRNGDARSNDYSTIASGTAIRSGHADDVWKDKFGHRDPRGGGRSSGRETVARVMAGSVAQMLVKQVSPMTRVVGFSSEIGPLRLADVDREKFFSDSQLSATDSANHYPQDKFVARFPSPRHVEVEQMLLKAKSDGESYGGVAEISVEAPPTNLGQPVFHKLKNDLANAFFSVGAVSGVELGAGFQGAHSRGTDFHLARNGDVYGGIRGGISTGEKIVFRIAFKPTSSIMDVAKRGRHDPCIVPRAVPVLEAMAWLVLADHVLWSRQDRAEI